MRIAGAAPTDTIATLDLKPGYIRLLLAPPSLAAFTAGSGYMQFTDCNSGLTRH